MRKGVRYTVPLPDPVPPPADRYLESFASLPLLRRIILTILSKIRGRDTAEMTRLFLLARLADALDSEESRYVDPRRLILLPAFTREVQKIRLLLRETEPLQEQTMRNDGGAFLRFASRRLHPDHFRQCLSASEPSPQEMTKPDLTISELEDMAGSRVSDHLEENKIDVYLSLDEVWRGLVTLRLFSGAPFKTILPDVRNPTVPVPVIPTAKQLTKFYQILIAAYRYSTPVRLEVAQEFFESDVTGPLFNAVSAFLKSVPILDIIRLGTGRPLLEIPVPKIPVQWWDAYEHEWKRYAAERIPPRVLQARFTSLRSEISRLYNVVEIDSFSLPRNLYPRTLSIIRMLMDSDLFARSRKAVTQLVIDAVFHRLDLRNELHQAILKMDHGLERTIRLVGTQDSPGILQEEEERVQRNSQTSSAARRRIRSVHDRFRAQIITDVSAVTDGMLKAGEIVQMGTQTWRDSAPPYELDPSSMSRSVRALMLQDLEIAGNTWTDIASGISALYEAEDHLRNYRRR